MSETIKVTFIHPREGGRSFAANINLQCTGQMAIEGLILGNEEGPFLEPVSSGRPYELMLKRTHQGILPIMTFVKAGVIDGDIIEVRQAGPGGGFDFSEIAEILIHSGITLAFLRALTQIIVQLLKNRESRRISFKVRNERGEEEEIIIEGSNSADDLIKVASKMAQYRINLGQHDVTREGKVIDSSPLLPHDLPSSADTVEQRNTSDDVPRRT